MYRTANVDETEDLDDGEGNSLQPESPTSPLTSKMLNSSSPKTAMEMHTGSHFRLGEGKLKALHSIQLDDSGDSASMMMKGDKSSGSRNSKEGREIEATVVSSLEIEDGIKEDLSQIQPTIGQQFDTDHTGYDHHSDAEKKSTILQASFNYINSIVGAGIIGLPYAVQRCGAFAGIFMLVFVGLLNRRSTVLLVQCGLKRKALNYEDLMENVFGKWGYFIVGICMFIFTYGAMLAYVILLTDSLESVFLFVTPNNKYLTNRDFVMWMIGTCIILPLCMLRDISDLSFVSLASLTADIIMVIIICSTCFQTAQDEGINLQNSGESVTWVRPTIFSGIGAMSFAFVCQHSTFIVFRSLKNNTVERWWTVTNISIGCAIILCVTMASFGYFAFLDQVHSDIFLNYPHDSIVVSIGRVLLALTMLLTYPMEAFVNRHILLSFSGFCVSKNNNRVFDILYYVVTVGLWFSIMILGANITNLGIVLELTGATSASALGYILPGLLYFYCYAEDWQDAMSTWKKKSPLYIPSLTERMKLLYNQFSLPGFLVLFGTVVMVCGVAYPIYELSQDTAQESAGGH